MKRLYLIALYLTLGACSGMSPVGANRDSGVSSDGQTTIASSGETGNTPMPIGNVAPIPDPRCGGEGEPPCPEALQVQARATLLCRHADTGDLSIQLEGSLFDPAAVDVRHIRILQEDSPVPQYTDVTVKLGEGFSIHLETSQPSSLKFFDVQNWHPPLNPAHEKDCPGYECIKEMGINAVLSDLQTSPEAAVPPCVQALESEVPFIEALRPKVTLPSGSETDPDSEGPAVHLPPRAK